MRTLSEELGYTDRASGGIATHAIEAIVRALGFLGLRTDQVATNLGPTALGRDLVGYFELRARLLNTVAKPSLMNVGEARSLFIEVFREVRPNPLWIPWNKQKGPKKAPAFLTGIVNMVLSQSFRGVSCDFDPLSLTTVTLDAEPFRTMARRVDGAFPSAVNPVAVWEIKEYYYTTTFGSRVADGIYETLLDGLELDGLEATAHGKIDHYLVIDARDTWWGQGNPYLCRLIDMLHMGYVDEVVFGSEVVAAMRVAAERWMGVLASRKGRGVVKDTVTEPQIAPPRKSKVGRGELTKRIRRWNDWARRNGLAEFCVR